MVQESRKPRRHIQIGKTVAAEIANPDYSEWTLEELLGIRTNRRGKRGGRPPIVVPMERIHEINKRLHTEEFARVAEATSEIIQYLVAVAKGEVEADKNRVDLCRWFYERKFGKAPDRVQLTAELTGFEQVQRTIVIRDADEQPAIEASSTGVEPWEISDDDRFS